MKCKKTFCVTAAVVLVTAAAMASDEHPVDPCPVDPPPQASDLAASDPTLPDASPPRPDRSGDAVPSQPRTIVPLERGSPPGRLGSGTRGAEADSLPDIEALAPERVGFTLEAQPALYWYLSRPSGARIDLRVLALDPTEKVLETTLPLPRAAGIQRIRLADHGLELAPGHAYLWLVILVPNPSDRSWDRIAGGGIERVEPRPELEQRIAAADRDQVPVVLAESGLWYDAIDALSTGIRARPGDERLRNLRASLFEQEGLPDLALEDSGAGGIGSR